MTFWSVINSLSSKLRFRPLTFGALLALLAAGIGTMPALLMPTFADLFWQIAEGRAVLAGHLPHGVANAIAAGPWIDHEWLFEALAAAAYDHGYYRLLVAICALLGAAIPIIVYASVRSVKDERGDLGAGIAAFCCSLIMTQYDALRPLQFGATAFALLLLLLRRRVPEITAYAALTLLWANLHASAVLAPILCSIFLLSARKKEEIRYYAAATIATALASLCTPWNIALYTYAIAHLGNGSTRYIAEWKPFHFEGVLSWLSMGIPLAATASASMKRRIPLAERILAVSFLLLALRQQHHLPFVAAASAGVISSVIATPRTLRGRHGIFMPAAIGVLTACGIVEIPMLAKADLMCRYPELPELYAKMDLQPPSIRAYIDYDTAGYSAFSQAPLRLLIDSHADPFSNATFQDWADLTYLAPGWDDVLRRDGIRLVIVKSTAPIAQALALLPAWRKISASGAYVAFALISPNDSLTLPSQRRSWIRAATKVNISR